MSSIGVYWGAFDPPTLAHTAIILQSFNIFNLSLIYIVINAYKGKCVTSNVDIEDRKNMILLALKEMNPNLEIEKIKIVSQTAEEYNYDKLKKTLNSNDTLYAIVGADSFVKFHDACKELDQVIVVKRDVENLSKYKSLLSKYTNVKELELDNSLSEQISSSKARSAIANKDSSLLKDLLASSVQDYIKSKNLYK